MADLRSHERPAIKAISKLRADKNPLLGKKKRFADIDHTGLKSTDSFVKSSTKGLAHNDVLLVVVVHNIPWARRRARIAKLNNQADPTAAFDHVYGTEQNMPSGASRTPGGSKQCRFAWILALPGWLNNVQTCSYKCKVQTKVKQN